MQEATKTARRNAMSGFEELDEQCTPRKSDTVSTVDAARQEGLDFLGEPEKHRPRLHWGDGVFAEIVEVFKSDWIGRLVRWS
jgi:hypothetical protein